MFKRLLLVLGASACLFASSLRGSDKPPQNATPTRCVVAELFVTKDCPHSPKARKDIESRPGLEMRVSDVSTDEDALRRLYAFADKHKVQAGLPMFHACNQVVVGYDEPATKAMYDRVLTLEVYAREGCPRCAAAKSFLHGIKPQYPGVKFEILDVLEQRSARQRYEELNRAHGVRAPGLPSFGFGGQFIVGYAGDDATGAKVRKILEAATAECKTQPAQPKPESDDQKMASSLNASGAVSFLDHLAALFHSRSEAAEPQKGLTVPPAPPGAIRAGFRVSATAEQSCQRSATPPDH